MNDTEEDKVVTEVAAEGSENAQDASRGTKRGAGLTSGTTVVGRPEDASATTTPAPAPTPTAREARVRHRPLRIRFPDGAEGAYHGGAEKLADRHPDAVILRYEDGEEYEG